MKLKILAISDFILCMLLAYAFTAAPYYINTGGCEISLGVVFTTLVTFLLFLIVTYKIRKFLQNYDWTQKVKRTRITVAIKKILSNEHATLLITLIILIAWAIPLVFLYPGTIINDTWNELQQFIGFTSGTGGLQDHHPVFDTMIMGLIIVPLSQLTGRWHIMIFLYVLLQAILTGLAFASTINYAYKKLNLGINVSLALLLAYCVIPVFPVAVQTVSKDALHSWGFIYFVLFYIELVRTNGTVIKDKRYLTKFILVILYCCLTKKVGFYVILISLFVFLIFQKKNWKYLLVPIVSAVLLMNVIMPILMTSLNIAPGGKQEMFSLPFQMTARYVKYHGDDITEEEYKILDKVLTMDTLVERYNPTNADPVKEYYQKGDTRDYLEYIKVWFIQGLRHPGTYISAFNSMLSGWFSWHEYMPLMNNDWRNLHNPDMIPEWVPLRGFSEKTANAYQEMIHNLYNIPILQIVFTYGFYASLVPAFAAGTVLRKWKNRQTKYWLAVLPTILALMLGCWMAPVSILLEGMRYLYPVVYTLPLLIAWCVYAYKCDYETHALNS